MEPERKVSAAPAVVNSPGDNENAKSKPNRHLTPHLPVELTRAEDPWGQIHRHEPQRDCYYRDNEWKPVEVQRDDAGDYCGDLHENPTALNPYIEVVHRARSAECAPPPQRVLNAKDRQWCHRHCNSD